MEKYCQPHDKKKDIMFNEIYFRVQLASFKYNQHI